MEQNYKGMFLGHLGVLNIDSKLTNRWLIFSSSYLVIICVCMGGGQRCWYPGMNMEVKGQFCGVGSLHQPCGSWGEGSGPQLNSR